MKHARTDEAAEGAGEPSADGRPLGVVLLAILALLSALGNLIVAVDALRYGETPFGPFAAVLSVPSMVFVYGNSRAKRWAWHLGLVVFGLWTVAALFEFASGGGAVIGLIIGVLAIAVLLQRTSRAYFGHAVLENG